MFNLKEFIEKNIVDGVKNGTFTKEYANITAVNYMLKGVLLEENIISINDRIEQWENEVQDEQEETIYEEELGEL